MSYIKTRPTSEGPFEIDEELAGLVPMPINAEQIALMEDIRRNGQKEPIVLWHGKVIDGRSRQKALITLSKDISYKELDNTLTKEEVEIFVKSVNTRRNLTHTQKTMASAYESMKPGYSILRSAKAWAVSDRLVKNGRYIITTQPIVAKALFDGKAVQIINGNGKQVESNKVSTVYAHFKRLEEAVIVDSKEQHGFDENAFIKTQAGKDFYYTLVAENSITPTIKKALAELANYKFLNN